MQRPLPEPEPLQGTGAPVKTGDLQTTEVPAPVKTGAVTAKCLDCETDSTKFKQNLVPDVAIFYMSVLQLCTTGSQQNSVVYKTVSTSLTGGGWPLKPILYLNPPVIPETPVVTGAPDATGDEKFLPGNPCRGPCRSPAGDPRPG